LEHLIRVHPSLHGHQFSARRLPHDIGVRMHGTDFIQVLLNLTVNAFQSESRPHAVEITGAILEAPLDLSRFRDGLQDRFLNVESFENNPPILAVQVKDTGPGIPPDVLPRIFQPYFTTKGARQGTGLGLNIVQRLIREAKGALHVHTLVGEGTAFTAYLPAAWLVGA
jgi:signal transduction histidine kinase